MDQKWLELCCLPSLGGDLLQEAGPSHYEGLAVGDAGQRPDPVGGLARGQHGRAGARAAGGGVWAPPVALL